MFSDCLTHGGCWRALLLLSGSLAPIEDQPLAYTQSPLGAIRRSCTLNRCGFPSVIHAYSPSVALVYLLCHFLSQTNFFFPQAGTELASCCRGFNPGTPHPHCQIQQALISGRRPGLDARPPAGAGPHSFSKYLLHQDLGKALNGVTLSLLSQGFLRIVLGRMETSVALCS